jgi:type II secretory pathway pseudopilin PulG
MKIPRRRQQAGYALILMVLGLMGIGGIVLAGFTQQAKQDVDQQRYLHNKRVLEQAKQALLMYAYNYPQIAGRGPGRLPCPDTNNTGVDNNLFNCVDTGDAMVGRFPWNAAGMNFFEIRDADGEQLWYAVSQNFARTIAGLDVVNSDTLGSITISDQTGALIYDADPGVATGVAAIIIAPGPPIARDENNDGVYEYVQDRVADPLDPRNYLDTYNAFDNSAFVNDESDSDDDGFIIGPV